MKKHFFWTVLICSAMISCKKDSTTVNSNVMEPLKQTKVIDDMFFNQDVRKFVKLIPEIKGYSPAKLFQVEKKDAGIHKYLLYLNGDEKARPIIILSKTENVHLFDLAKIDLGTQVHFFDESGKRINGALKSKSKDQKPSPGNYAAKEQGPNEICIDWYWVIVDTYTGEIVGEIFIETKCYSQGEGGGGGLGGGDPLCNMTEEEAETALNAIKVISTNVVTENEGFELTGPGRIEKPKTIQWMFVRLENPMWTHTEWSAYFEGIVYKNNQNDYWKWDKFKYNNFGMSDGTIVPCTDVVMNVGAVSTVISSDKKTASASIAYDVKFKVTCLGGAVLRSTNGGNSENFEAK